MNMVGLYIVLSNDWQIETAFRAYAEIAGRDRKISDPCRKGYSCPMGENNVSLHLKQYFSSVVFYTVILLCNCLSSGDDAYKLQSLLSNPNMYSRLSLSRLRLSRITAYLEEKIWSLF